MLLDTETPWKLTTTSTSFRNTAISDMISSIWWVVTPWTVGEMLRISCPGILQTPFRTASASLAIRAVDGIASQDAHFVLVLALVTHYRPLEDFGVALVATF